MIADRCLEDQVAVRRGEARISLDAPTVGVVEPGDPKARRPPLGLVALRMDSQAQRVLLPASFGEREAGKVNAFDLKTRYLAQRRLWEFAARSSNSADSRAIIRATLNSGNPESQNAMTKCSPPVIVLPPKLTTQIGREK